MLKGKDVFRQQVCAGRAHSLINSDDGIAFAFGEGTFGQLGNALQYNGGNSSDSALPTVIQLNESRDGLSPRVVQVSAGDHHSACVTADGKLYTWGLERSGRLGHGRFTNSKYSQASNGRASKAVTESKSRNTNSQGSNNDDVAINDASFSVWPTAVNYFIKNHRSVKMVSCGADHTLCIDESSVAFSWGLGNYGALGLGNTSSQYKPTVVGSSYLRSSNKWTMVSAGAKHSLFLNSNGVVFSCGHGANGRLGLGTASGQLHLSKITIYKHGVPVKPPKFRFISAGEAHSAIIDSDGKLYTFGCGAFGRLGHGVEEDCNEPTIVDTLQQMQMLQVDCGLFHTVALSCVGDIYTFGAGGAGQLGHPPDSATAVASNCIVPTQVLVQDTQSLRKSGKYLSFIQVSAGSYHTLAVDSNGMIRSWGCGSRGRLGHPPCESTDIMSSAAGSKGRNFSPSSPSGETPESENSGSKSRGLKLTPTQHSFEDFAKPKIVAALSDILCGGMNLQKEDPEWQCLRRALKQSKVVVDTVSMGLSLGSMSKAIKKVACGCEHTLALTRGGHLYSWGTGTYGQLGLGEPPFHRAEVDEGMDESGFTTKGRKSEKRVLPRVYRPTRVPDVFSGHYVIDISCGSWHSMALAVSGIRSEVFVWGRGNEGQHGDGSESVKHSKLMSRMGQKTCKQRIYGNKNGSRPCNRPL